MNPRFIPDGCCLIRLARRAQVRRLLFRRDLLALFWDLEYSADLAWLGRYEVVLHPLPQYIRTHRYVTPCKRISGNERNQTNKLPKRERVSVYRHVQRIKAKDQQSDCRFTRPWSSTELPPGRGDPCSSGSNRASLGKSLGKHETDLDLQRTRTSQRTSFRGTRTEQDIRRLTDSMTKVHCAPRVW